MKVTHAQAVQSGYGHKKITVELENVSGERKTFSATTNNMPDFDDANDLKEDDIQGYYNALYRLIEYQLADQVEEWLDKENE